MRRLFQTLIFAEQVSDLEIRGARVRDLLKGVKAKLLRNPEFGTQVGTDPPLWFIPTPDILDIPLGISYTFDEHQVTLVEIWFSPPEML